MVHHLDKCHRVEKSPTTRLNGVFVLTSDDLGIHSRTHS
jgi:hypothetical protein